MTVFRFVVCGHTHTHVHVHIHTPKNSISQLRIHALAWGKGVNRFGIAGTQRSRKKTYSIPITRLIRPNPPVFCRGRQSRFPFYRGPGCTTAGEYTRFAPAVATTLPVFATRSSISSLHTRNPGIPAKSRAISRYSTCYPPPSAPIPRICQLVYSEEYEFTAAFPTSPVYVQGFLKTYCRQQPNRASFLPFRPSRTSRAAPLLQSSIPSHRSPRLSPLPPIPYTDLSYTSRTAAPMESNVLPVSRLPLHAPFFSILLPIFHRFLALLLPCAGYIRLNSRVGLLLPLA